MIIWIHILVKKFVFLGYVYRMYDFKDTQFVLARDMLASPDNESLIVGFLCDSKKTKNFENNTWVEIIGEITKGYYHGDIPVIKIKKIKQIDKPNENVIVYPPDDTYVPTMNKF